MPRCICDASPRPGSIADARRLQGPDPTFNDLLDLDTAWRIACDFTGATCCITKQLNPVGLASNDSLLGAYRGALETDRVAAYGAVVAVNRVVDAVTAEEIVLSVYEALAAPGFADDALEVLATRPALTLLEVAPMPTVERPEGGIPDLDLHRIDGGVLVQTQDRALLDHSQLNVVTKRRPTLEELTDLLFAWRAVRHVTSNAVVLARHGALVGVGAGQASRLTAVEIALHRASDRARDVGAGVGCLLPVRRRHRARRRARRHGHHPAGRFRPGRDGHRGRRPAPHGDGVHREAPLPTLITAATRTIHH